VVLDDERFLGLLHREQGKLLRLARMLVDQEDNAWDLVQDATLAAYTGFSRLRGGDESFGPWIRRILVNRARNRLRAQNRFVLLEEAAAQQPDPTPGPEERLDRRLLWSEVACLAPAHRQVLALRFLVDMEVADLARLLRVPEGTVKSRLHRALCALRERLLSKVPDQAEEEGGRVHGL